MIYIAGTDNETWQISAHKTYGDASGTHIRGTGVINTKNHAFYVSSVHDVLIEDNYVGVNTDGSASTGLQKGIHIGEGANNITIQNNVFSGANLNAIEMNPGMNQLTQTMGYPHDIQLIGNMIGTDITGIKGDPKYGNKGTGININGAKGNIEITGNIITPAIDLVNSTASPVKIVGIAPANSKVDLYMVDPNCFNCIGGGSSNENQGKTYVGSVDADASGK